MLSGGFAFRVNTRGRPAFRTTDYSGRDMFFISRPESVEKREFSSFPQVFRSSLSQVTPYIFETVNGIYGSLFYEIFKERY